MESTKNQLLIITTTIEKLKEVFESTNKEGLISLADHYWLVDHETNTDLHLCTIYDIMQSDMSIEDNDMYCDLIDTYGKDVVNKFVHSTKDNIEEKVVKLIKFVLESIYKTDDVDVILFPNATGNNIQDVIINAIANNFDVSDVTGTQLEMHLLIKR
jgi:energy-converting hydrogenase A subunit M